MLDIFHKYNKMIGNSDSKRVSVLKDSESLDERVRKFNEKKKSRE